jgi:hypothetical protein
MQPPRQALLRIDDCGVVLIGLAAPRRREAVSKSHKADATGCTA